VEGLWRPGYLPTQAPSALAGVRQIVETVYEKLWHTFRLDHERPHDLSGCQARVAAKMALHNFCLWLNDQLGRPRPAFTELVDW
jgi:hypothetical protein